MVALPVAGLVPVVDLVLFGGSTCTGLDGRRFRTANVAVPWKELAVDGVGELLELEDAGPV